MNRIHIEKDGRVVILTGGDDLEVPEVPEIEGDAEMEHGTSD